MPVKRPVQALEMSKAIALLKPKWWRRRNEVLGSKEKSALGPSQREILVQISRSISAGVYLEFLRHCSTACFARSNENSVSPAILLLLMPVSRARGKRMGLWHCCTISSVETALGGR